MSTQLQSITLYLMTRKGYEVLQHIVTNLDSGIIAQVVGARDKAIAEDFFEEIKSLCAANQIPFRKRQEADTIVETPYALAISWRWLITGSARLIVLHDSLLPRYRGFAPLVNCLINGESEIGVTALYATAEFDRGAILAQAARTIQYPITIAQAIERSVECYNEVINIIWPSLMTGETLPGVLQQEELATYSLWRDEQDYLIDWQKDSNYIKRFVDALGWPYQGAACQLNAQLVRIAEVAVEPDVVIENRVPGKVLFVSNHQPVVVCGSGLLRLIKVVDATETSILPLKQFRSRFH